MERPPPLFADWMTAVPLAFWVGWVFLLGLGIGSFLNVLIARLPWEKSPLWPGSRCFSCLRPLRLSDNLPIIGYLRLGGRCRYCKTPFSARYLWVELFTGLAFVGLYLVEVVWNTHKAPGLKVNFLAGLPSLESWVFFAAHAFLLAALIASAVIDAGYRIIPTHITYAGTLVGLAASALCPWPWPNGVADVPVLPNVVGWHMPQFAGRIPTGLALWPGIEPTDWAPAGSWQLGLLTGLMGAAGGMFVIRSLKWVFEFGFGQEAVGLGDADLLMMAGAFLGWQPVVLAVPVGAFVTLGVLPLVWLGMKLRGKSFPRHIPFGPGLAAAVVLVWLGWPLFGELVRTVFFQPVLMLFMGFGLLGCLLVAGLLLRR